MPSIGVAEVLLLLGLLIAAVLVSVAVVAVVRTLVPGARARRASPLDRMPDAWVEQHAVAEHAPDRRDS